MRAYFFCNYYLSSIQQGIQAAHCVADMFTKYQSECSAQHTLYEWAIKHKTMILLNGGNNLDLNNLYLTLRNLAGQADLPYEIFKEDNMSLNEATTCVGVVLPEKVYVYSDLYRKVPQEPFTFNQATTLTYSERTLGELLSTYSLAR